VHQSKSGDFGDHKWGTGPESPRENPRDIPKCRFWAGATLPQTAKPTARVAA